MYITDIIEKKSQGKPLTEEEIKFFVMGYTQGTIPDYQIASLLMAIKLLGMTTQETAWLTSAMVHSGQTIDLSPIKGVKVDKHSTGGVGDKTSLVLAPLVASVGLKVAKMSGRGLGHTGGTLDKLESIPGMSIALSQKQFIDQVNRIGLSIIGQTSELVPADKKLYALRDVTGTVQSIPLISSSIMSKKLASGGDTILLDVKFGSGAFMKTVPEAKKLAQAMVDIGTAMKKDTRALITDMDQPLGRAIGNILEVKEAIETLNHRGPEDFETLCLHAGAMMLIQAKKVKTVAEGITLLTASLTSGSALTKFKEFIAAQGGDVRYIDHPEMFPVSKTTVEVTSAKAGYVLSLNALNLGQAAMKLGAGRETKDAAIDYTAGIVLHKKVGDKVAKGEVLAKVYTNKDNVQRIVKDIAQSFEITAQPVKKNKLIYAVVQ